ncbi:MAG: GtrA family protein [Desulfurococcaceae archaeon]
MHKGEKQVDKFMKKYIKEEDLVCTELGTRSIYRLCGTRPWIDVLKGKMDTLKISKPISIYANISYLNKILLKILRIKPLAENGKEILISYIESQDEVTGRLPEKYLLKFNQRDWFSIYRYRLPGLLALPLSELHRVIVYLAINTTGILVNLLLLVFTYNLLLSYVHEIILRSLSSLAGFEASVMYNFTLHEIVTFKGTGLDRSFKGVLHRLVKFHLASTLSLLSQLLMANILPIIFGLKIWIAQLVGIIIGFIVNFIFGYIYTWSRHRVS